MSPTRRQLAVNAGRAAVGVTAVAALASCATPVAPRRHAYLWRQLNGYRRDLVVCDANGGNLKGILPSVYGRPAWGQGGTSIAVARPAADDSLGTWGLWLVRPDGSSAHRLTNPPSGVADLDPVFSPDGNTIAFSRDTVGFGYGQGIWLVEVNGTGLRFLPGGGGGISPSFSPDGKYLVYANRDGIHRSLLNGGDNRRIAASFFPGQLSQPTWSPDGKRVAFARLDSLTTGSICYVNATGGSVSVLTSAPSGVECPAWSRDSATLTYARFDGVGAEGRRSTTVYRQVIGGAPGSVFRPAGWFPATDLATLG